MAVQARARLDRGDRARFVEHDAPLRQVEVQGAAPAPGGEQGAEDAVEGRDDGLHQRFGRGVGPAVAGGLHLLVGQPRGRAHEAAQEAVPARVAGGVDPQLGGQARPLLAGVERAPAVGQRLGQHGHDPVGKVGGVAALEGGAVEAAVRAHVPGHVGDRDHGVPAAGIGRVGVGLGPDRVVEVARVGAVDGHQRQVPQVDPLTHTLLTQSGRAGGLGLGQRLGREFHRQVMLVDRDQAERARAPGLAQALQNPRRAQAEPGPGGLHLGQH